MDIFEHAGVYCGREHGALVDRRCDEQLLQGRVRVHSHRGRRLASGASAGYSAPTYSLTLTARGQDYMGDGGLYTLWAGLMALACLMILFTIEKGALWRERAEEE